MSKKQESDTDAEEELETTSTQDITRIKSGRKKVDWTKKKILMIILFSIVVIVSIALLVVMIVDETFLFQMVRKYFILPLLEIGYWAILVFLILMIIQSLLMPIPSEIILLSGAMIFGLWLGIVVGVIGSVLSGIVTFYLSNKGGRPILEFTGENVGIADRFIVVMDKWIEKWGIWAIIVGRAVPIIMFDPVSYAAGISNMKWKVYSLATFIGSIPRAIFYSILGVQMLGGRDPEYIAQLTQAQFDQVAGQFNLIFFIIFGVLVLMLILATILGNRIEKKTSAEKALEIEEKN